MLKIKILKLKIVQKEGKLSLKLKIILFGSIGLTVILIIGIVLIVSLHNKSEIKYKMEISDLETEKEVLENQNSKMRNEIQNLTSSNSNLSKKLNAQSKIVINDEQKKNETYKTLEVISKEGASLKTTFAKICFIKNNFSIVSIDVNVYFYPLIYKRGS